MARYSQKFINKAHDLKESGLTIKEVSKKLNLKFGQVNYILYSKNPTHTPAELAKEQKSLDELYDDADEAVKEAQTLIKRIKRLFFGA